MRPHLRGHWWVLRSCVPPPFFLVSSCSLFGPFFILISIHICESHVDTQSLPGLFVDTLCPPPATSCASILPQPSGSGRIMRLFISWECSVESKWCLNRYLPLLVEKQSPCLLSRPSALDSPAWSLSLAEEAIWNMCKHQASDRVNSTSHMTCLLLLKCGDPTAVLPDGRVPCLIMWGPASLRLRTLVWKWPFELGRAFSDKPWPFIGAPYRAGQYDSKALL